MRFFINKQPEISLHGQIHYSTVFLLLSAIIFYSCAPSVPNDTGCGQGSSRINISEAPLNPQIGNITFTVSYTACGDFANGQIWFIILTPNNTYEYEADYNISAAGSGNFTRTHYFSQPGRYYVYAAMAKSSVNKPDGYHLKSLVEFTISGSNPDRSQIILSEAIRYKNYSITWFNRSGNAESDINDSQQTKWSNSFPYSVLNSDVLETMVSKINNWTQTNQTRWYQYSPGKLGINYYDLDHYFDSDYPWPDNFDDLWTGNACQAFLYHCAKKAGYSFTSNDNFRRGVNYWQDLGTQITANEVQPGDIACFFSDGQIAHVGLVESTASQADNINIIHCLGIYQDPFNYQVSKTTVGSVMSAYNNSEVIFRRLPLQ